MRKKGKEYVNQIISSKSLLESEKKTLMKEFYKYAENSCGIL